MVSRMTTNPECSDSRWSPSVLLATGFGIGFVPFAPGTVGSLWGLVVVWTLEQCGISTPGRLLTGAVLFAVGIPVCSAAAKVLGRDDPCEVVFDEIAAFPLVFCVVPWTAPTAIAGFLWFRLFDIAKPWPIRRFEALHGGLGVMADDQVAGLYAGVALWLTHRFLFAASGM